MQHQYAEVPRYTNARIAAMRDCIDPVEVMEACAKDALEPATHKAWRNILRINGTSRFAIMEFRAARENLGKGYVRIQIAPGCFESKNWTQATVDEAAAELARWIKARKVAWGELRFVEMAK
jgi:hypothetical protein